MNPANSLKSFRVILRSINANSFGLSNHVILARDGECFAFLRSRGAWNAELPQGTDITLPLDAEGRVSWRNFSAECVQRLPVAPWSVVAECFPAEFATAKNAPLTDSQPVLF